MTKAQLSLFPYLEHQVADRPRDFIPVYEPWLGDREEADVADAVTVRVGAAADPAGLRSAGKVAVAAATEFRPAASPEPRST